MTEQSDWGDVEQARASKGGVPKWLLFCGGGCLLLVIVGVLAVVWGVDLFQKSVDPERQWPRLSEVLPHEERPETHTLLFGSRIGVEMYMLQVDDPQPMFGIVFVFPDRNAKDARQLLDPEVSGAVLGMGGRENLEPATVEVQGRQLEGVRFTQGGGNVFGQETQAGHSITLDVTPEGGPGVVILQLTKPGMSDSSPSEPISDAEVQSFLAPFEIGPDGAEPLEGGFEGEDTEVLEPPVEDAPTEPPVDDEVDEGGQLGDEGGGGR